MTHQIAGRLRAQCAPGVEEPIAGATLTVWMAREGDLATFAVHQGSVAEREGVAPLARGVTGGDGSFRLEIEGESMDDDPYHGGPLMIEVRLEEETPAGEPVRLRFGRVAPRWNGSTPAFAHLELPVAAEQWASVRDALDVWTVHGRVHLTTGAPAAGHTVFAYDCDALHDDFLGSASVAADGRFRLDFRGSDFRPAPIGGFDPERGGPDLHFFVKSPDGIIVYEEPSRRGMLRDRANVSNWFDVELRVESRPPLAVPAPLPPHRR